MFFHDRSKWIGAAASNHVRDISGKVVRFPRDIAAVPGETTGFPSDIEA
jgi:hypothetical protein